ncbi:GNAT family N-acetyltransferase [Chitinivorax sp. B]|uniref:GNAT family N-acetyltransferase n=1 Tax=Chitinivorax sp. B TaxID=2502235 RepID=UPI0010F436DC|nr:GNAT family N-acetyltransferase [Chitinivorax sp. B]
MDTSTHNTILHTARLTLRPLTVDDAAFIMALVNDPDWLHFIGSRDVHSLDDARRYIQDGPMVSYVQHGFGMYLTERTEDGTPLGLCGLIRRDTLPDIDIGYAFLPASRGHGYAREATQSMLHHAQHTLKLTRLLAITSPDNQRSIRLLEHIGMTYERDLMLPGDDELTSLFSISFMNASQS